MPYIEQGSRVDIELGVRRPSNAGELNYCFTRAIRDLEEDEARAALKTIIAEYLQDMGLRYQYINDIIGALEGCILEHYRQMCKKGQISKMSFPAIIDLIDTEMTYFYDHIAAPYEDVKIEENGDV